MTAPLCCDLDCGELLSSGGEDEGVLYRRAILRGGVDLREVEVATGVYEETILCPRAQPRD